MPKPLIVDENLSSKHQQNITKVSSRIPVALTKERAAIPMTTPEETSREHSLPPFLQASRGGNNTKCTEESPHYSTPTTPLIAAGARLEAFECQPLVRRENSGNVLQETLFWDGGGVQMWSMCLAWDLMGLQRAQEPHISLVIRIVPGSHEPLEI